MPLYEYQCEACGHRFEVIQRVSDAPMPVCPTCGGAVHKLQSAPAIQFKGSGWYITDYARKDQKDSSKSGSAPADDSKQDSGGKADKPAETTTKSGDSSPASTSSSPTTPTKSST